MDAKKFSPIDWKRARQLTPLSELRRDMGVDWRTVSQEKKEVETTEGNLLNKIINSDKEEFCPLTKLKYQAIVKARRRQQVHDNFLEELGQVFDQLEYRAMQMTDCHFEVSFDIGNDYDIDKVEVLLRDYFLDLGFDVIVAERGDEQKVVLTLT